MKENIQMKVIIEGMVQGVFYRATTRDRAQMLGLTGWVKNMPDRSVHALFQGSPDLIDQMIEWCWQGSPASRVDHVHTELQELENQLTAFEVRY